MLSAFAEADPGLTVRQPAAAGIIVLPEVVLVVGKTDDDVGDVVRLRVVHAVHVVVAYADPELHVLPGVSDLHFRRVVHVGVEVRVDVGGLRLAGREGKGKKRRGKQ